jgi:hypothetical protein
MPNEQKHKHVAAVDSTAERVALWRAMHVLVDPAPHVLEDVVGLQLANPADGWRDRGDMHPRAPADSGRPSSPGPGSLKH